MRLFTILLLAFVFVVPTMADDYNVDAGHSIVMFRIKHLGVSNFYGRFNDVSGNFSFIPNKPTASKFNITVKADSIDTNHKKRDRHLKGPDFFSARQYKTINFTSGKITKIDSSNYMVTGKLNLHGVTKEIKAKATFAGAGRDPWGGYRCGFEFSFSIKRSDFGMKYMIGGLSDKVDLTVSLEGKRK